LARIFSTLAILTTALLAIAFVTGWSIEDPKSPSPEAASAVSTHMLTAMAALVSATLVHAIVLTYFMGTGRWMEETSNAYSLGDDYRRESNRIKYRLVAGMTFCLLLLIAAGASGAAADPASAVGFQGWGSVTPARLHFLITMTTLGLNLLVSFSEFLAIARNGEIVEAVLARVRQERESRGLPV
jgi:hypothetical protein